MEQNDTWKKKLFMRRIASIEGLQQDSGTVKITFEDGSFFEQYHESDCCEYVRVEQVDADPTKFIGANAHDFVVKHRGATGDEVSESGTWTFYTLKTSKGYLDWRWLGESNGYYSESVTCNFTENN